MTVDPSVSVVITNHNYRAFVIEAIESVLSQQHRPSQVIVVDDGSTDGSADFIRQSFPADLVTVIATENRGQLAAFIAGVAAVQCEIVAFLDADDAWEPNYLTRLADIYRARPEIDFVFTNMRFFDQRDGVMSGESCSHDFGLSILLGAFHTQFQGTATSAVSLRAPLARKVLTLPETMVSRWRTRADDCLVVGSDILGGRKFYLAETLVRYRAHGNNAWLDRKEQGAKALMHWLRAQSLIEHYRFVAGLSPAAIRFAKHEFRSKPQPRWLDVRNYSALLSRSDLPFWQRMEHRISMIRHWLHARRDH